VQVQQDRSQRQHLGQQGLFGGPRLPPVQLAQQNLARPLAHRPASGQRFELRVFFLTDFCPDGFPAENRLHHANPPALDSTDAQ
jgi:hypothetical protein